MSHQGTPLVMIPVVSPCVPLRILINDCHIRRGWRISRTATLLMFAHTQLVGQRGSCWWDEQWWIACLMPLPANSWLDDRHTRLVTVLYLLKIVYECVDQKCDYHFHIFTLNSSAV